MSVIVGRALPDARDGLKPAQRRILYAMSKLGNFHDQPTKKSARIVGDTIGKYHPHGDMAAYETLVRLAQDFTMNHTLVEGQGNMGSIDGDPPAAQRYTEVRLTKLAEEMLEDLDKKAVSFVPNFDNTEDEPIVLPSKIPNLLVNGASGIAVGVTTSILQHNLMEVCSAITAFIDNKNITNQELLQYIKGPDFPTGGIVFYNEDLIKSYIIGKGSCTIRGRIKTEEQKDRKTLIIDEIPYAVNKAMLIQKIAGLVKEKKIQGISDLRDESNKDGIRIVIELKKDANPEIIINMLYTHTPLQVTIPVRNVAVMGNNLITMDIRHMIKIFVEFRIEVIRKRTQFELAVASDRNHIVEGLLTAMSHIDEIINLLKKSNEIKDARQNLINNYSLSEKQANAILDMKLSKLTHLETKSLEIESADLKNKINQYNEILKDENKINDIIKEETKYISERYGRKRKTTIEYNPNLKIDNEELITDEDTTIILTNNNYVKRMQTSLYKSQSRGGKGVITIALREGDFVKQVISCKSKDYLLLFTNKGRVHWLKAYQISEENRYSIGKALVNFITLRDNEKVEKILNTRSFANSFIIFISKHGKIKKVNAEHFSRPRNNGIIAMPLLENDSLANVCISNGNNELFIATRKGKALHFKETDLREMGRNAIGVRGIRLNAGDEVINILAANSDDLIASVTSKGFGKITELNKYRLQKRGGKGVINLKIKEKTGEIIKVLKVDLDDNIILFNSQGMSIEFPASEVRITGRGASGVRLMKIESDSRIVDAQVAPKQNNKNNEQIQDESVGSKHEQEKKFKTNIPIDKQPKDNEKE
ncbi:MAG: DNA topoisomerase (ATP-hydrolyzing) subunit A [Deltaproteobacteria bacterium]|nr:DNA topoisomerase (ATP-hydrolyzing) subunit A [Deltaproteobacteria bacterium]